MVAQHLAVGMDAAFDRLRRYARGNNLRLALGPMALVGLQNAAMPLTSGDLMVASG